MVLALNDLIESQDRRNAKMILDSFFNIFEKNPEVFRQKKFTLLPLNYIMGDFISEMPH
jgi:hypothetical protein